jgi:hypothetical protein
VPRAGREGRADQGRLDLEAAELLTFARRLLAPALSELPVVPIETLFPDGADGIVSRGTSTRGTAALLSSAAVVSRGERLFQTADDLAAATAAVPRDLRLHRLLGELSGLSSGLPPGLDIAVESFAVAARAAVARGDATLDRAHFTQLLREAGERLRGFTDLTEPMKLAGAFDGATRDLDHLGQAGQPPVPAPVPQAPEPAVVPIESLAPADDHLPIVPIESLLYEELAAPASAGVAAIGPPPAAPRVGGWDIAASFAHFEALVRGPTGAAAMAATEEPPREPAPAAAIVDITELLFRGPSALEEANRVRIRIRSAIAADHPPGAIPPLLDELLDLVELAAVS